MSFRSLQRYLHSLPYLSWRQVAWRLFRPLRRWRGRLALRLKKETAKVDVQTFRRARSLLEEAARAGAIKRISLEDLRNFHFNYLNRSVERRGSIPWGDTGLPKLWRYQLHGFRAAREFAMAVFSDNHLGDRDRALFWMRDWMEENPPGRGVGWDGWPLCERLLAWALLMAAYHIREKDIVNSWAQQARWLSHTVEYDLQGNHLLKNALVLTLSGDLLQDTKLYRRGLKLLEREVAKQILSDGGHVERSLLYHNEVLWDSLIVLSLLKEAPVFFVEAVSAMTRFTDLLRHPDGDIPLFGDAVFRESPHPSVLVACVRVVVPSLSEAMREEPQSEKYGQAFPASGYYLLGDGTQDSVMIVKTAAPSPSCQPGHSHGDMLSCELSLKGKRFVVDTGTHGYGDSPYRAQCRSTKGHNTVQLGDHEQAEHWHTFRMGRRGEALPASLQRDEEGAVFRGGAAWYQGGRHERYIKFSVQPLIWEIRDSVQSFDGEAVSRIHFHPSCEVEWMEENKSLRLCRDGIGATVEIDDSSCCIGKVNLESFSYFPEFGKGLTGRVLEIRFEKKILFHCRYLIKLDDP
ncbi:MAG: hypothetical protein GX130_04750 [Candidatus Hydrogenedens sp.]|nr:hypothetical protein [Candidatus Hydrogenedens sp.]